MEKVKVYVPESTGHTTLFGAKVEKDEGGKFLMLNEECAQIAVKQWGGTIAPVPAAAEAPAEKAPADPELAQPAPAAPAAAEAPAGGTA